MITEETKTKHRRPAAAEIGRGRGGRERGEKEMTNIMTGKYYSLIKEYLYCLSAFFSSPPHTHHNQTSKEQQRTMSAIPAQEAANVLFTNSTILAPMVRASTIPLRTLALSYGASLVYTEELIDRSILDTERVVNTELGTIDYVKPLSTFPAKVQKRMVADTDNPDSSKGAILLRIDPSKEKDKLIYQIGTGEAGLAVKAAERVVGDVSGIDVNMGCPKKFSVSGGMGRYVNHFVSPVCT